MLTFVKLSAATAPQWDDVAYHSDDGWAFHLSGWLAASAAAWQRECHSLAVVEEGRMLALLPLGFNPETRILSSGPWTDGGPIIVNGLSENRRRKLWQALLERGQQIGRELGALRFQVTLTPLSPAAINCRWGVNPLLDFGITDTSSHAWIVDLGQTEPELHGRLSENITRQLKKARAAGYTVRQTPWREMFDRFYDCHRETYARSGQLPVPLNGMRPLMEVFEGAGHSLLWTCLDSGQHPIGFHTATLFKQFGYYHHGCVRNEHLEGGVNALLFWTAMLELKARGCRWYGFGDASPLAGGKAKTLSEFKRKFGAEMHRWFKGEVVLAEAASAPPPPAVPRRETWLRSARNSVLSLFRPTLREKSA